MQEFNEFLIFIDQFLGSADYFVPLLLGTGIFFTIYLSIINSPFAHILKVLNKQEYSLIIHVGRFIILFSALFLMSSWSLKLFEILIIFSLLESLYYLFISIFTMKILSHPYGFYLKLVIFSLFISFLNLK